MFEKIRKTLTKRKVQRERKKKLSRLFDDKQVERNMKVNNIRPQNPDFRSDR